MVRKIVSSREFSSRSHVDVSAAFGLGADAPKFLERRSWLNVPGSLKHSKALNDIDAHLTLLSYMPMAMVVSSNLLTETDTSGRVYPGNTYDYSPFNASVQAQLYNNLYGAGNCVDQIKDCAARGIDEICEAAVSFDSTSFIDKADSLYPGCLLCQPCRISL